MRILITIFLLERFNIKPLLIICFSSCLFLILRFTVVGSLFYAFLIKNLVLALIPYFLSLVLKYASILRENKVYRFLIFLGWLLFLPNSFYILTDFIHLLKSQDTTLWLDISTIAMFSTAGFTSGIFSLFIMEQILSTYYSTRYVRFLLNLSGFLSGFGIFLGRVLRLNSWDCFIHPVYSLKTIITILSTYEAWWFLIVFGGLIVIVYSFCKKIISNSIIL